MIRRLAYLLPLGLSACAPAPMTLERAEALCQRETGLADGVGGRIKVGVGTGGAKAGVGIVITDDVFNPKTPEEAFAQCVAEKTGRAPARVRTGIVIGAST